MTDSPRNASLTSGFHLTDESAGENGLYSTRDRMKSQMHNSAVRATRHRPDSCGCIEKREQAIQQIGQIGGYTFSVFVV